MSQIANIEEARNIVTKRLQAAQKGLEQAEKMADVKGPTLEKTIEPNFFVGSLSLFSQSQTRIGFEATALKQVGGLKYTYRGFVSFTKTGKATVFFANTDKKGVLQTTAPNGKVRQFYTVSKTAKTLFNGEVKAELIGHASEMFFTEHQKLFEKKIKMTDFRKEIKKLEYHQHCLKLIEKKITRSLSEIEAIKQECENNYV